jgi:hypothetical protein
MQLVDQGSDKMDSLYYVFTRNIQNSGVILSVGKVAVGRDSSVILSVGKVAVGRDSSIGIATGYGLDGPGIESRWGGEIFRTRPDRPWAPPPRPQNSGDRVFAGGKAAGAWGCSPTPSSAEVKERVELYLYSVSGPSWPVLG